MGFYAQLKATLQQPRFAGLTRVQKAALLIATTIQKRRPATRAEIIARAQSVGYAKILSVIQNNPTLKPAAVAIRDLLEAGDINEPLDAESAGSLKTIVTTLVQGGAINMSEAQTLFGGVDEDIPETVSKFGVVVTENDIEAAETPKTITHFDASGVEVPEPVKGGYTQETGVE